MNALAIEDTKPENDPDRKIFPYILLGQRLSLQPDVKLPIEIGPNIRLYKATPDHIDSIYRQARVYLHSTDFGQNPFEVIVSQEDDGTISIKNAQSITDFHYWVVEHRNRNHEPDLEIALALSKLNLTSLIQAHGLYGYSGICCPAIVCTRVQNIESNEFVNVDNRLTQDLISTYSSVTDFFNKYPSDDTFPNIKKALNDFISLNELSDDSPFKIVALFSILELLLTSKSDTSITKQLKSKINLVHNRMPEEIDISDFFNSQNPLRLDTAISKLYTYRSAIAHGNVSDFNKDLQILETNKSALSFLHNLTREVLAYSIREPKLISDLREC